MIVDFEVPRLLLFKSTAKFDQLVLLISEFGRFWIACLQAFPCGCFALKLLYERFSDDAPVLHPVQIVALARLKGLVELSTVVSMTRCLDDFDAAIAA